MNVIDRENPSIDNPRVRVDNIRWLLPPDIEEQAESLVTRWGNEITIENTGGRIIDPAESATTLRVLGVDILQENGHGLINSTVMKILRRDC